MTQHAATDRTDIAAITVTYNSGDVLRDFLDSCIVQQGDWRLIVVDNASTDDTRAILRDYDDPRITVVLNDDNVGFAGGCNIGIRMVQDAARSILLVNNDTVFDPDTFQRLFDKLVATRADAVTPLISAYPEGRHIWYAGGHVSWWRGARNLHERFFHPVEAAGSEDFETRFCPACFMLIDTDVFRRIGLMTEDYFVYWEDVDFGERMRRAGARTIVTPSINVRHKISATTGTMSDFTIYHLYRNRILFSRRFGGPFRAPYTFVMTLGAVAGRALFKGDSPEKARLRLRAMMAGLCMPARAR